VSELRDGLTVDEAHELALAVKPREDARAALLTLAREIRIRLCELPPLSVIIRFVATER